MFERLCVLTVLLALACATPKKTSAKVAATVAEVAGGSGPKDPSLCHPACSLGFACNEDTGKCLPIPCGGKCRPDQVCNSSGMIESCVLKTATPTQ